MDAYLRVCRSLWASAITQSGVIARMQA